MALRILLGLGCVAVTAGAAIFSVAAGLIVAGVLLIAVGLLFYPDPKVEP